MRQAELRQASGRRLAQLGYRREHYSWHAWRAVCHVLVDTTIVDIHLPTRASRRYREAEWARIPRRGPPRRLLTVMKADGEQIDMGPMWGENRC